MLIWKLKNIHYEQNQKKKMKKENKSNVDDDDAGNIIYAAKIDCDMQAVATIRTLRKQICKAEVAAKNWDALVSDSVLPALSGLVHN